MPSTTCKPSTSRRSRSSCSHRLLHKRLRVPLATKHLNGAHPRIIPSPALPFCLPRTLPRPCVGEVKSTHINAAYPELAGVTPEYIRERLPLRGARMLAALASVTAQAPTNSLPKELEIVMRDVVAADCPTHMLAVHAPTSTTTHLSQPRKVTLFPVHQLVLTTNCTNLPALPCSSNVSAKSCTTTLPVVPLCLPSAETYPILQSYLYTKHMDSLLSALIPATPCNMQTLARHAMFVNGLWKNACALGVVDETLWDAIDLAWGNIIDAIAQAS